MNEYIDAARANKYLAANLKAETEAMIMLIAKSQLRDLRITTPVFIRYLWVEPNARRDKDNIAFAKKFIQDSLVKAKILAGDGWSHIIGFSDAFKIDRQNPHIDILIREGALQMSKNNLGRGALVEQTRVCR